MADAPPVGTSDIERIFREEDGRAVAVLVRHFGDIDLVEEAVQDAFTAAVQRWPASGLPPSPAGWIITTARHRAIDRCFRPAMEKAASQSLYEGWQRAVQATLGFRVAG